MDAYFKSEGFDTIGFEESVWVRPAGGKYSEDIYVSAHVDDCLMSCKSVTLICNSSGSRRLAHKDARRVIFPDLSRTMQITRLASL
jgi:hypothetical protein